MDKDAHNSLAVHNFLSYNSGQGFNWVAFDQNEQGRISGLTGFESAMEADRFCEGCNSTFDYIAQDFVDADYGFIALDTLRKAMGPALAIAESEINYKEVMEQLAGEGLRLFTLYNQESIERHCMAEILFPVEYERIIHPRTEIDRYAVISHHHAGHHVYEIGHSVHILGTFLEKTEAVSFLNQQVSEYQERMQKDEFTVIGLYRGQEFRMGIDGTPENYSGVVLTAAYHQYDSGLGGNAWRTQEVCDIDKPIQIQHSLFVQYDHSARKCKLFDDRLNEVLPQNIKVSSYPAYYINEKFTIKQLEIMNEQSYDYLANQLKYLGFGEEISKPLREKMAEGANEFTLNHTRDFGKDKTESVLHFSKGDDQAKDLTFFNRYDMTLKQEGKADLTQNFFVGKDHNYTLQERYNMMDGRFVYREQPKVEPREVNGETKMVPTGETYLAWKGLNFKESDERGNFLPKTMFWKHEREIVKYPLKEIQEPYDKNRLLASMEKGNKANVTIIRGEEKIKGTVVANPKMQRFDFYDANGQTLFVKQVDKQKLNQGEGQAQGQTQQPEKVEGQAKGQQQNQGKNETATQANQQSAGQAESKGQAAQPGDHAKEAVAEEKKEGASQRKRQGVKI